MNAVNAAPESPHLIVERDAALPLFHLSLSARRGSLTDPATKEGTTRLLLRLMRRAVEGMTAERIDEQLDLLGATLSIDVRRSSAGFVGSAISRSKDEYLDLLARVLTRPTFDEAEFERIREESLAEWTESLDNDSTLVRRAFNRRFYGVHPYARLSSGTPESLARITLGDLREEHERLFSSHFELAAAGDIDVPSLRAFGEKSAIFRASGKDVAEANIEQPTGPKGRHLTFVDKPERSQTQIMVGCMGTHPRDDDHTALYVGHTIFGGTFNARLSQEVRGKRGWSYGAYSDLPYDRMRQAFTLWTFPQASDAAACITLKLELLEHFIREGVSKRELTAAKKYLKNSYAFSVDTAAKRAAAALDRRIYDLPDDYHSGYLDRVSALDVDAVNMAIAKRLSFENLEVTVVGTHSDIGRSVEESIPGLSGADVVPFDAAD